LGSQPKQGLARLQPGSEGKCEGMNPHTPKRLPPWELESCWTFKFSKSNCEGQNPMN